MLKLFNNKSSKISFVADAQDADFIDDKNLLIATENGGAILDIEQMKKVFFVPLKDTQTAIQGDFLTAKVINDKYLLGIHTRLGSPDGVWEINNSGKYQKLFSFINEPVTGINYYNNYYYIATLKGIYKCNTSSCSKLLDAKVNKIDLSDNKMIFASFEGSGLIDLTNFINQKKDILWLTREKSHSIQFFPNSSNLLLIGTFEKGVIKVRIK